MKKLNILMSVLLFVIISILCFFIRIPESTAYDIVSGVAIDNDGNNWFVTCEICLPSKDEAFGTKSVYVKGKGYTLKDAFYDASLSAANTLYTDSVRIYVISDALKNNSEVYNYFFREPVNMRSIAIYCNGKASDILNSEATETDRTKSISIVKKIEAFCFENKTPVPEISEYLKNSASVTLGTRANPERSGVNE